MNTMTQVSKFIFSGYSWSSEERKVAFFYKVYHNGEEFNFTENLTLPLNQPVSEIPQELLKNVLDNLSLAIGISYYKLFCPKEIVLENITLSKEQAEFWNTLYTKGLGEFFYNNKIDFRGLVNFPFSESLDSRLPPAMRGKALRAGRGNDRKSVSFPRQNRSLVGIGGGKDSIVAGEMLKKLDKPCTAFVVNDHPIKEQTIELLDIDKLVVKRQVDPLLLELNKRPDAFNGHVPFSAIIAFISIFTALIYDYRSTIFANEKSANYGSVLYLGTEINHQWSKSFEFEKLFQDYVETFITQDIKYFSILRPFNEIVVAQKFAAYKKYFPVFSSCNKNFRIIDKADKRWCGQCSKCAFVFALLAAFLSKKEVVKIFGEDLFAKEHVLQIYKELLGVENIKPFDCVGTPEEVKVAFYLAMQKGEYNEDIVMKFFEKEVLPTIDSIEALQDQVFTVSKNHKIPEEFVSVILTD